MNTMILFQLDGIMILFGVFFLAMGNTPYFITKQNQNSYRDSRNGHTLSPRHNATERHPHTANIIVLTHLEAEQVPELKNKTSKAEELNDQQKTKLFHGSKAPVILLSTGDQPNARQNASFAVFRIRKLPSSTILFSFFFCSIAQVSNQKQHKKTALEGSASILPLKTLSFLVLQIDHKTAPHPNIIFNHQQSRHHQ